MGAIWEPFGSHFCLILALSLKSHFSELSLESNAFELLGISVLACIWLRFSRKVVGCMGPFASGASKNVAGACLSQHFGQFLQKRHLLELSLESSAFGVLGIRVPACIWLRFSIKVVGCLGPFAWGASKNVAGACLSQHFHSRLFDQVDFAIRLTWRSCQPCDQVDRGRKSNENAVRNRLSKLLTRPL